MVDTTTNGSRAGSAFRRAFRVWSGSAANDRLADLRAQAAALNRSQAVIEFDLGGRILRVNDNFLKLIGYGLEELVGQHHSMLVEAPYRTSEEYRRFWETLRRGECQIGQYRRLGKGGRELWLQASYNPVADAQGKPYKVLELASDVTAQLNSTLQIQRGVGHTQEVDWVEF